MNAGQQRNDEVVVVVMDPDLLRKFISQVYAYGTGFIIISCVLWLITSGVKINMFSLIPVHPMAYITVAFVFLVIFMCIPYIRYRTPWNWIFAIIIVLLVTLVGVYIMGFIPILEMGVGIIIAAVLMITLQCCGARFPKKMLPGIIIVAFTACLGLIVLVIMVILMAITDDNVLFMAA
ncbi:uncharacterized protein LOC115626514 [Scaptodrosophila lebanonensis]|uniref:Uncharacterized protein LOC115626514 n=1 Tax=Drosophila lebanonensis TaxID=7225 RepID=A0A6J2TQH1_DROLE|nr:uncharacterized protein LOC115626514 [Scaptodrosophila lebanonensis]